MNENLWKDYRFLTRGNVGRFLARQELDMFYELLDQRQALQAMIEETDDDGYLRSEEGTGAHARGTGGRRADFAATAGFHGPDEAAEAAQKRLSTWLFPVI